jgi:hypothetical protein
VGIGDRESGQGYGRFCGVAEALGGGADVRLICVISSSEQGSRAEPACDRDDGVCGDDSSDAAAATTRMNYKKNAFAKALTSSAFFEENEQWTFLLGIYFNAFVYRPGLA